jgi:aspartate/methionine/tyrosine aminotransferase
MNSFSQAFNRIGTENAFAVGPEIASYIRQGYDIVRLNIGEPGCGITKAATEAAIRSFDQKETHYTPSAGTESLRREVSKYLSATRGIDFLGDDIVLTPGGKPVIAGTILILVNPGDEVVYPTPCYPIYESIARYIGAKTVPLLLREDKGFRFDLDDLAKKVNRKTKLLVFNSPSNPTGGVMSWPDLEKIAQLAQQYDFYILSDEIYSRLVYGSEFKKVRWLKNNLPIGPSIASLPNMAKRTIILDGFSKTYAMTGLRLGFAATKNRDFISKFLTFAINFWSCLPQPCMAAAEASLLTDQTTTQQEIKQYEQKRDKAVKLLNTIKGVRCHIPKGAFYLFPNVTKACQRLGLKNAEALRQYLLTYDKKEKKGVAVLARQHFGQRLPEETEEYIRLSIAGSESDLMEGIKRIKQALER